MDNYSHIREYNYFQETIKNMYGQDYEAYNLQLKDFIK